MYRNCSLLIDEMSIKSPLKYSPHDDKIIGLSDFAGETITSKIGTHATVLMARGIFHNWKQPLAYWIVNGSFKAEQLKETLEACIPDLISSGLIVCLFVSDQGSNFQKFVRLMEVTPERPYFYIGDTEICFAYDTPHLYKSVRNCLLKNTIKVPSGNDEVKFEHFQSVYDHDSKRNFRMMPKLTPPHMNPTCKEKMRVKYSTQLLSSTMAACIDTYVSLGKLPVSAMNTAGFTSKFDGLFDILNSSHQFDENKPLKSAFCGTDDQIKYLNDMKVYISKLKVTGKEGEDRTLKFRFLRGWQITIAAILRLWDNVRSVEGVEYLLTRRLNSDPIENFFGRIRENSGCNNMPTVDQFTGAFKSFLYGQFLNSERIQGANCERDKDDFLFNISDIELSNDDELLRLIRNGTHNFP